MIILGIETSCDETAVAVVEDGVTEHASLIASQVALHAPFGGVVPELASRHHLENLLPLLAQCLRNARLVPRAIDAIAVTHKPGLIGSLLVGVSAAKALALAWHKPMVAVDHVHAHAYSAVMGRDDVPYPLATLVVSGGHTSIYAMRSAIELELVAETVDDAAGEAFDKVAAILGLGYPGGPAIDQRAAAGNPLAVKLPRSEVKGEPLAFSFSGIKTAVLYHCCGMDLARAASTLTEAQVADVCASFQHTVVEVLLDKLLAAAHAHGARGIALGGGVVANSRLRARAAEAARSHQLALYLAERRLTTDNAVMVAGLGYHLFRAGRIAALDLDATAH
ncbi:MAG: tRNA (adenosine(37)-N6)-threonylcarbamoyltransferase complex transferase subunit TsaD [Planctomycetota bacterium]